jgi:hypothetical protein
LSFDQVYAQNDFVIDDVSIKLQPKNCNSLLLNGNAEYGPTPSFWTHWSPNGGTRISLEAAGNNNRAFRVHQRELAGDGIHQSIDPRCLVAGTTWKFTARMRLFSKSTGNFTTCDPADNERFLFACPPIRIATWKDGVFQVEQQTFYMSNRPTWSANGYNNYQVIFTVDNALASSDQVSFGIRGYNTDWDLYVDNMVLQPV